MAMRRPSVSSIFSTRNVFPPRRAPPPPRSSGAPGRQGLPLRPLRRRRRRAARPRRRHDGARRLEVDGEVGDPRLVEAGSAGGAERRAQRHAARAVAVAVVRANAQRGAAARRRRRLAVDADGAALEEQVGEEALHRAVPVEALAAALDARVVLEERHQLVGCAACRERRVIAATSSPSRRSRARRRPPRVGAVATMRVETRRGARDNSRNSCVARASSSGGSTSAARLHMIVAVIIMRRVAVLPHAARGRQLRGRSAAHRAAARRILQRCRTSRVASCVDLELLAAIFRRVRPLLGNMSNPIGRHRRSHHYTSPRSKLPERPIAIRTRSGPVARNWPELGPTRSAGWRPGLFLVSFEPLVTSGPSAREGHAVARRRRSAACAPAPSCRSRLGRTAPTSTCRRATARRSSRSTCRRAAAGKRAASSAARALCEVRRVPTVALRTVLGRGCLGNSNTAVED